MYFYKEKMVYPHVEIEVSKKGLLLKNTDYPDICHMEYTGYAHL